MRYREKQNKESYGSYEWHSDYLESNSEPDWNTFAYISSIVHENMADISTPNFKKYSNEGKIVNSPMYRELLVASASPSIVTRIAERVNDPDVVWIARDRDYVNQSLPDPFLQVNVGLPDSMDAYLSEFSSERNVAIMQAWSNVDESEMMALATLGELPETVQYFVLLYQRAIGIFKRFLTKRGRLRAARKSGKDLRQNDQDVLDMWMELRYAIRPLMYDMEQMIAVFANILKPIRNTARGYHYVHEKDTESTRQALDADKVFMDGLLVTERESTYRAGVLYEFSAPDTTNWPAILGLDQPLESIYELTRLSFLLSWFLNVGEILSSFSVSSQLSPLSSWISEHHVVKTKWNATSFDTFSDSTWNRSLEGEVKGYYEVRHELWRRQPAPSKTVLPSVRVNLDWMKLVDMVAIARSVYSALRK